MTKMETRYIYIYIVDKWTKFRSPIIMSWKTSHELSNNFIDYCSDVYTVFPDRIKLGWESSFVAK